MNPRIPPEANPTFGVAAPPGRKNVPTVTLTNRVTIEVLTRRSLVSSLSALSYPVT